MPENTPNLHKEVATGIIQIIRYVDDTIIPKKQFREAIC